MTAGQTTLDAPSGRPDLERYQGTLRARELVEALSELDPDTFVSLGPECQADLYGVKDLGGGDACLVFDEYVTAKFFEDYFDDDEEDYDEEGFSREQRDMWAKRQAAIEAPITGEVETIEGNSHPVVRLEAPWGGTIAIDAEMAGVISSLWRASLHTTHCCQDHDNDGQKASIGFTDIFEADKFQRLVWSGYAVTSSEVGWRDMKPSPHGKWEWWFSPFQETPLLIVPVTVKLPRSQLADIKHYLARADVDRVVGPDTKFIMDDLLRPDHELEAPHKAV